MSLGRTRVDNLAGLVGGGGFYHRRNLKMYFWCGVPAQKCEQRWGDAGVRWAEADSVASQRVSSLLVLLFAFESEMERASVRVSDPPHGEGHRRKRKREKKREMGQGKEAKRRRGNGNDGVPGSLGGIYSWPYGLVEYLCCWLAGWLAGLSWEPHGSQSERASDAFSISH